MDVYIPLALYILFVSIVFFRNKKVLTILTFVPLLLYIGTRVGLGVDYDGYEFDYNYQKDFDYVTYVISNIDGKFEPGFFVLMKLMPTYNSFVFASSLIYVLSVSVFFYKLIPSRYYFLAFLLWLFYPFFFESFVAMRSSLAMSFFLLACCAKHNGRQKMAVILVLLSVLFHMSGILLLIPILISSNVFEKYLVKYTLPLILVAFVMLLVPSVITSIIKSIFSLNKNFDAAYQDYFAGDAGGAGFYLFSLFRLGFIYYILSLLKKGIITGWLSWIAGVTILYYLLLMIQGIEITYRVGTYFFLITVVFKCFVVKIDKSIFSKVYLALSILYSLIFFYGLTQNDVYEKYFHYYHSFLFDI